MGESAEDCGGPRREFWALLGNEIQMNICEGRPTSCVIRHDSVGLVVRLDIDISIFNGDLCRIANFTLLEN